MRRSSRWAAFILALLIFALLCLWPLPSLAGETGSVSVSVKVGPCVSVASDGTVRSNVSVTAFADAAFLTIMAR